MGSSLRMGFPVVREVRGVGRGGPEALHSLNAKGRRKRTRPAQRGLDEPKITSLGGADQS